MRGAPAAGQPCGPQAGRRTAAAWPCGPAWCWVTGGDLCCEQRGSAVRAGLQPSLTVASRRGSPAPPLPACDGPLPVTRSSVLPGGGPEPTPPQGCMPDGAVAKQRLKFFYMPRLPLGEQSCYNECSPIVLPRTLKRKCRGREGYPMGKEREAYGRTSRADGLRAHRPQCVSDSLQA